MTTHTDPTNSDDLTKIDALIDTLHDAEKPRTLEEQIAYMKERGIDPTKNYQQWDDDND